MKKNTDKKSKLVVILGPTSSGKTGLAVGLATKFMGEIIGADSRQVYRDMDIGTGKDLKDYGNTTHHLIDVADPSDVFSLAQYKKLADQAIKNVVARGKLPLLVGGSGLYLQAVVDNFQLSKIKVNQELRDSLETLEVSELYDHLKKLNQSFAEKLQESDRKNKRRLIRYIEINHEGKFESRNGNSPYEVLIIGIDVPREELNKRIKQRLLDRLEEGLVDEVRRLHKEGVSWKRLEDFGLEYRFVSRYLQGKYTHDEMVEKLNIAIRQFAKRQTSWFRRWEKQGRKIEWLNDLVEADNLIKKFMK